MSRIKRVLDEEAVGLFLSFNNTEMGVILSSKTAALSFVITGAKEAEPTVILIVLDAETIPLLKV